MNQLDKDIAALRDGIRSSICRQDMETTLRDASLARILDALEEAREVVSEAAMCQLCGGNPCSRADDETGCIDPDNICSHKARAFLAKYGEGEK